MKYYSYIGVLQHVRDGMGISESQFLDALYAHNGCVKEAVHWILDMKKGKQKQLWTLC